MREITPESFQVFTHDELEPDARERAIEAHAGRLGGEWWDQSDTEEISDAIVYALAEKLGTPGHDRYGEGDFPGIPGVSLQGWDLDWGRGQHLVLTGELNRDNAPALPWTDELYVVLLEPQRDHTHIGVAAEDFEGEDPSAVGRMQEAVSSAMYAALKTGRVQLEWLGGTEHAEEEIQANGREFTADGTLYTGQG